MEQKNDLKNTQKNFHIPYKKSKKNTNSNILTLKIFLQCVRFELNRFIFSTNVGICSLNYKIKSSKITENYEFIHFSIIDNSKQSIPK